MTYKTDLYFECHITVEPVYGYELQDLKELCAPYKFHVADLLMRKRMEDTPERSQFDTFCTGRGVDFEDLLLRMDHLVIDLHEAGFEVWRYKIENTLLDERMPHDKATRATT